MKSQVAALAQSKGIKTPSDLHFAARISWPVAKNLWEGDISNVRLDTGRKVAAVLGCSIDELFIYVDTEKAAS